MSIVSLLCSVFIYHSLSQAQAYKGVVRDPYSGDVAKVANSMKKELGLGPIDGDTPSKGLHGSRVQQGVRDLHESSFSLSGRWKWYWTLNKTFRTVVFWSFQSIIKLKRASVLLTQGLKLMTTSRKGPRLEFWPLPVVVPVVSGNHWCQSVSRPTLHVLYNSNQPGKLHWFLITGIK